MKKMSKLFTVLLTAVILCSSILPVFPSAEEGITPYYSNTNICTVTFVAAEGEAMAAVSYFGKSDSFAYIRINVTIQKRFLGIFWSTIDEWGETYLSVEGHADYSTPIEDKGTYRAVFDIEVHGTDGSVDTINEEITSTYE